MATIQHAEAAITRARARVPREVLPWALVASGAAAWLLTLRPVTPADLTDIGLLPALPAGWWLGVLLASLALAAALVARPTDARAGVGAIVLLAAILYATPALVEPLPRFNTVYVHLGLIEAIERTGRLFPELDARFSWPVFFTAMVGATTITGIDLLAVAAWVPVLTTLLALPAAWLLSRAFTDDSRLSLLMLWVLLLGNWVGQDYLSPQGFNFLLYVWFLALLAWFFGWTRPRLTSLRARLGRPVAPEPTTVGTPGVDGRVRAALVLVTTALAVLSVPSHQLTPFAMIGASLALVLFSRTTLRWMPLLVAVMTGFWVVFAGYSFLAGHLGPLLQELGNAGGAAQSGVAARIRGSDGHVLVVSERILFSLVVWGLAGLGLVRRWWAGHWDVAVVVLAAFPFGLIALQSYGGEIFLRVFLFALPPMAFLAAAAVLPGRHVPGWGVALVMAGLTLSMAAGFVIGRYGNEAADIVLPGELQAVDRMHAIATPRDTVMASLNFNSPVRYRDFERFDFVELADRAGELTAASVVKELEDYADGRPALLLVTRGQLALERLDGVTDAELAALSADLDASPLLEVAFRNADGTVYRMVPVVAP